MTRRDRGYRWKAERLQLYCDFVIAIREEPDHHYVHESQQSEDAQLDAAMYDDDDRSSTHPSQEPPNLASPMPQTPRSPNSPAPSDSSPAAAASPPAAAASAASSSGGHGYELRRRGPGAPAWKAAAGADAQKVARDAARLRHGHQQAAANELLAEHLQAEGTTISSPHAQKQAKSLANDLYATAGGLGNAVKVLGKLAVLPEIREILEFIQTPEVP